MTVPLIAGTKRVGALVLANDDSRPPFTDADLVTFMAMAELTGPFLDAVVRSEHLAEVCERLSQGKESNSRIIGSSNAISRLREEVSGLANTMLNILIRGESGTGKELVARSLHELSARCGEPYLAVNCAAVPPNLFESEFFGYAKGAFTGAFSRKEGIFDRADGGTVLLDEIGDLSLENQAKLLRVLESGTFMPVGATAESHVDIRIVAATNKLLQPPDFREDLYHRLAVAEIETAPLRQHPSDIPLLARYFLDQLAAGDDRMYRTLSDDACDHLRAQPWPGNGRELRNAVERAAHLSKRTELTAADFPCDGRAGGETGSKLQLRPLSEVEMDHIHAVLDACGGSMKDAAKILGISRSTLYTKVPRHVPGS